MEEHKPKSFWKKIKRPFTMGVLVVVPLVGVMAYGASSGTFTFGDSFGFPEAWQSEQVNTPSNSPSLMRGRTDTPADSPAYREGEADTPSDSPSLMRGRTEHVPLPDEVRGIYWTVGTAGSTRGDQLIDYMNEYGLNSVVVDLKMDNGALAFTPNNADLQTYAQDDPVIDDLDAVLQKLKDNDIYRIARIPVMRDSTFATAHPDLAFRYSSGAFWRDNTGAIWVDPAAPEVADYAVALGREAYARGFDEIQFDYVRFASDGRISAIQYPVHNPQNETKVEVMQRFFKHVGEPLREDGIPVSHDLFGMTFWNTHDFNIGQRLLDVYPHADFISPMVYPSHYPDGFYGHANPATAPYWIVNESLNRGAQMMLHEREIPEEESRPKFRPWIQDFDIGAVYTSARIEAQIQAARDAGASGWMLWNARNVYEPADYR